MMKRFLWTAAVLTAVRLIGSAAAADVPVDVAAWTPRPSPPAYDWNGFYAGAHMGGSWQQPSVTINDPATGIAAGTGIGSQASFAGGAQIGVNFALWPIWMFGMEADISGALLHGIESYSNPAGTAQVKIDNKTDMYGTFRGRTGYTWDNWLFYATGGFAWADALGTETQVVGTAAGATQTVSHVATGWVVGAGVEWAFAPRWTVRLEYLHVDVGPQAFVFTGSGITRNAENTIDTFRVGLNYRFNWMGQ